MTNDELNKINKEWEKLTTALYYLGYRKFNAALKKSIEPLLLVIAESQNYLVAENFLNSVLYQTQLQIPIQETMREFIMTASNRTANNIAKTYLKFVPKGANLGVGFGSAQFAKDIEDYIKTVGGQHIKDINDTTLKQIKKAFIDSANEGETLKQLSKRIEKYTLGSINDSRRGRSLLIARTETLMSTARAKQAQIKEFEDLGVEFEKQWVVGRPKQHRPDHLATNGKRVPKDNVFTFSGVKMKYAGDPAGGAANNCNCRCSTVFIAKEENE
jgi:uncharacterized protein with gpF-like domain